jgi:5-methylcytosine-specific restriction endonuclease McrA
MVVNLFYNISVKKSNKKHYNDLGYLCKEGDTISVKWQDVPSYFDIEYKCVKCYNNYTSKKHVLLKQKHQFTCKKCIGKINTEDRFKDLTGHKFGKLTVLSFNYEKNKNYYWLTLCECGNKKSINSRSFKTGRVVSCGCYSKELTKTQRTPLLIENNKKRSGENHHNWNPNLTEVDRQERKRSNNIFKLLNKEVFKRDNYTCQCCYKRGSQVINAHHIYPYAEFPDLRYNIDNLITLCYDCHKKYHKEYRKNINPETLTQFKKFTNVQ